MLPVVAIVGRPNVGKSTLFNRVTRSRDAIVADYPGLTRDRQYGFGKLGPVPYLVIDTGGVAGGESGIDELMVEQTVRALQEADIAIVMVDGRSGLTSADEHVADLARKHAKVCRLAVNKAEGLDAAIASGEFHGLGLGDPVAISASHGDRVQALMDDLLAPFADAEDGFADEDPGTAKALRIAVIGRPNVGKSTLINRMIGEERMVVYDQPGTTRDSVAVPFERDGRHYELIDTAGVRRKAKVHEAIEKFSIIKGIQAMERAQVVIALLDAREGVTEQDVSLMGLAVERGRALVVAANKWDGLDREQRRHVRNELDRRLPFLDFAERLTISALHGTAVGDLLPAAERAYAAAMRDMATTDLNRVLADAVAAHPPPLVRGRRIRLRYAHQGGRNPPVIVIHGNQTEKLPDAYRRYLINRFRKAFKLQGTPVRLSFKTSDNPYKGSPQQADAQAGETQAPTVEAREEEVRPAETQAPPVRAGREKMSPREARASAHEANQKKNSTDSGRATNHHMSVSSELARLDGRFNMHRGGFLESPAIAYETWGERNENGDNAILIFTGLSPSAHAASSADNPATGWWEDMIGSGFPLDTDRYFVICVNSLGSCFGSTGPASINPATGERYRLDFPVLTLEDVAEGGYIVARHLGLERIHTTIGCSMGGMSALAFCVRHPEMSAGLLSISSATRALPFSIAVRSLQREMIVRDPKWQNGDYDPADPPVTGQRLARKLGMMTYRSAEEWEQRFGRERVTAEHKPGEQFAIDFSVESYLQAHAEKFSGSFDANCYLYLSRASDLFDLAEHGGSLRSGFGRLNLERAMVIGVRTDILFPIHQQAELAEGLSEVVADVEFVKAGLSQGARFVPGGDGRLSSGHQPLPRHRLSGYSARRKSAGSTAVPLR